MSKKALVLPGGGANVDFQLGAMQLLDAAGRLRPDVISATSCGALLGLLYSFHNGDMKTVSRVIGGVNNNRVIYNGMMQFNTFFDNIGMWSQVVRDNKMQTILDSTPLHKFIDSVFGNATQDDLHIPIIVTVVNFTTGKVQTFDSRRHRFKIADVAKATSAIELLFADVQIGVEWYGDGGLLRNNPVCWIIDEADEICLIGTSPDNYPPRPRPRNLIERVVRMLEMIMHSNEEASWDELKDYDDLRAIKPELPEKKITSIYPPYSDDPKMYDALDFRKRGLKELGRRVASEVTGFTFDKPEVDTQA